MADFLNAQLEYDEFGQQGHYYRNIIEAIEPCGQGNEQKIMPWHPKIITEE